VVAAVEIEQMRLFVGDVRATLAELPERTVQTCVTSPPYFGLREYETPPQTWGDGWHGELGREPTPDMYVGHLVEVFRGVWRVLRDDGTLWLNLGDSYSGGGGYSPDAPANVARREGGHGFYGSFKYSTDQAERKQPRKQATGLKPKNLIGIPWRVALALQDDGWILRNDGIWHKSNALPEAVNDRLARTHEYIFLLAKQGRYFFDKEAIKEPAAWDRWGDQSVKKAQPGAASWIEPKAIADLPDPEQGRNPRTVWTMPTANYPNAHYAVFPAELPRKCILAGSAPGATVLDPFAGTATTLIVAQRLGRASIGIEVSPESAELARGRMAAWWRDASRPQVQEPMEGQMSLAD
jgi:DNA modification methylase